MIRPIMSTAESIAHKILEAITTSDQARVSFNERIDGQLPHDSSDYKPALLYELTGGPCPSRLWSQPPQNAKHDLYRSLGSRLYWETKPAHFPASWTAVVSSHTGRNHAIDPYWMAALHDSMRMVHRSGGAILQSHSSSAGSQILFAASRLKIPFIELRVPVETESVLEWLIQRIESSMQSLQSPTASAAIHVSPLLVDTASDEAENLPLVDRALVMLPDQVHAIRLRRNGKIAKLLTDRLKTASADEPHVHVTICSQQTESNEAAKQLMAVGAVGRYCDVEAASVLKGQSTIQSLLTARDCLAPIIPCHQWPTTQQWPFLTHCTRSRATNWPDQSPEQFSDEWLLSEGIEQFGPIASLIRILTTQRLIATTHLKRSDQETVCFSEVPLSELLARRRFRSHLGRWDWEPFGICIHRDYLRTRGAREVLYLPSERYKELDDAEKAFFQTMSRDEQEMINKWQSEKEWRVVGDVRLNAIPAESAFIFVPSESHARLVAPISRWPIAVVRIDGAK
jgi:hypothetical protein